MRRNQLGEIIVEEIKSKLDKNEWKYEVPKSQNELNGLHKPSGVTFQLRWYMEGNARLQVRTPQPNHGIRASFGQVTPGHFKDGDDARLVGQTFVKAIKESVQNTTKKLHSENA